MLFCPSRGASIPGTSALCIGWRSRANQSGGTGANLWTRIALGSLVVGVFATAALAQLPDDEHRLVLFTGQTNVPPGLQYRTSFATQTNYVRARVAGNVKAAGGAGNDIRVLILKNGSAVYDSGRRRSVVMSVDFSEPGQYTLVFDNSFSTLSPKIVSGTISLVYSGVDSAKNAAFRQELIDDNSRGNRILQRLYDALKADEQFLGTTQLSSAPTLRLIENPTINAAGNWAGNFIAVNRGTFQFAHNIDDGDDVLSFVLAHELGHIFYRHPGYGSATQGVKGIFDELRGVTALDRVQEQEADLLGIRISCQAGFDPHGSLTLMDKFAEQDPTANSFMKNHPAAIERRSYLTGEVQKCVASRTNTFSTKQSPVTSVTETGRSMWHISNDPNAEWTFERGKGYLFGERVLPERLTRNGDYDLLDLKASGDTYTGVRRERLTVMPSPDDPAKVCQWEFAVEVTAHQGVIEGRWERYSENRFDPATCRWRGERGWQPVAWMAE
jgi:hypothetical protein